MRLQSKKLNPSSLPPLIAGIFIVSLMYWIYLSIFIHMQIVYDAIGYESLGRLIHTQGWIAFFKTGPNREPLYPLLIALSMALQQITGLAYVKFMAFGGVIILFLTQVLTYKILRLLNISVRVCACVLAYFAISPALNNAAFSLFSEIAEFPLVLIIILTSYLAWEAIKHQRARNAFVYGMLLGISLTLATLVKAVFECVAPVYLIIFLIGVFLTKKEIATSPSAPRNDANNKTVSLILCFCAAFSFFYGPICGYKWLNFHYNGNFVVTDRGPWFLYGNTARRMEPLSAKRLAEVLAFVPGEGICDSLFGSQECYFWTFQKADELGMGKQLELTAQHLPKASIDARLVHLSIQQASHNPFQYGLLDITEAFKMFFWESTKVGFVDYPHWLQKIYDIKLFDHALRFLLALLSLIAVFSLWIQSLTSRGSSIGFLISILMLLYVLFFSFFFILTRYMLPMAPLYLICIGIWINQNFIHNKKNKI